MIRRNSTRLLAAALVATIRFAAPAPVHAQRAIRGTVTDRTTGEAIAGAQVSSGDGDVVAVSGVSGAFVLTSRSSVQSVTVRFIGYAPRTVTVADPARRLHIALERQPVELSGIEVVGQRSTPSVSILGEKDLTRANELDLASALNTVPGVFMQSRTPFGGAHITIRGYYPTVGNSVNFSGLGHRVFLDGIPLTNAAGVTMMDDVDYAALGQVEVIKGPASSAYGSYIGGTVLLTTKRPSLDGPSFTQTTGAGRYGLLRTNTSFQTAGEDGDLTLSYGYQTFDSFRPQSDSRKNFVRATGHFQAAERHTLSTYFGYTDSHEALAGEVDSASYYAKLPESNAAYIANDSRTDAARFIGGITDRVQIGEAFTNETTLFGSGLDTKQPFAHGFNDASSISFGARSVFGYAGALSPAIGIGAHAGAMAHRTNIKTDGVFIVPSNPSVQRPNSHEDYAVDLSLFADATLQLPHDFNVTAGVGLQQNRFAVRNLLRGGVINDTASVAAHTFDFVFTPRVDVVKELAGGARVYGSVSSGYAPPLLSQIVASDGSVNMNLAPERAVQYEIGGQGSLLNDRLSGRLALYDVENTDKLVSGTANAVTFTTNAGHQRNRGAELSMSYRLLDQPAATLSGIRPWVSYAYTDATYVDFHSNAAGDSTSVDYTGNAVPRVPKHMASGGIDIESAYGLYLNGSYRWIDEVPVTLDNATFIRGYSLLALEAGLHRDLNSHFSVDMSARGDNLTGNANYALVFVGPDYASIAQPAHDGYIIPAPYDATWYGSISISVRP